MKSLPFAGLPPRCESPCLTLPLSSSTMPIHRPIKAIHEDAHEIPLRRCHHHSCHCCLRCCPGAHPQAPHHRKRSLRFRLDPPPPTPSRCLPPRFHSRCP